jgi:hypothetical protein
MFSIYTLKSGSVELNTGKAQKCTADIGIAYGQAAGAKCNTILQSSDLAGLTLKPGVLRSLLLIFVNNLLYMYTHVYVYTCICMYMYLYEYIYIHMCWYVYEYMYEFMFVNSITDIFMPLLV